MKRIYGFGAWVSSCAACAMLALAVLAMPVNGLRANEPLNPPGTGGAGPCDTNCAAAYPLCGTGLCTALPACTSYSCKYIDLWNKCECNNN